MKKSILTIALSLIIFLGTAYTYQNKTHCYTFSNFMSKIEKVNLSADQKAKINEMKKEFDSKVKQESETSKKEELHKAYHTKMYSVLNSEQQNSFKELGPKRGNGSGSCKGHGKHLKKGSCHGESKGCGSRSGRGRRRRNRRGNCGSSCSSCE